MRPEKKLGQHFLISQAPLAEIIIAAKKEKQAETIIEVGPGRGALTRALAHVFPKIVAVEKDQRLAEELQKEKIPNTEIIVGDIRDIPFSTLHRHQPYAVIANIPYYLTGQLIRMFLEAEEQPAYMILMVQKEVAERIAARPPHMNILAVSAQVYGDVSIIARIPRTAFTPEPRVDSAIINIGSINKQFFKKHDISEKDFFTVVRAGFGMKRKTLANALSSRLDMPKEKIVRALKTVKTSDQARAETLMPETWAILTHILQNRKGNI